MEPPPPPMEPPPPPSSATFPHAVVCDRVPLTHPFGSGIFRGGDNPLTFAFPLFLFQLLFLILTTHLLRLLLRPLKQPRIVSQLMAGLLVGPSFLGRNEKFSQTFLPPSSLYIARNLGVIAFSFFLFLSGVKMDLSVIKTSGKKQILISIIGVIVPFLSTISTSYFLRAHMDKRVSTLASLGSITASLSITAFACIHPILKELNLLSSDIGRQALSVSIISDALGVNAFTLFEAAKHGEVERVQSVWHFMSMFVLVVFTLGGCRRVMEWVAANTPEGKYVEEKYVVGILVGVMVVGFLTDMSGIAIANGPLLLGLAIPDGPPLGATIVERCECIVMEVFMPMGFVCVGLNTDIFAVVANWDTVLPLVVTVGIGYFSKLMSYVVSCFFLEMSLREGVVLGFMLSLRGQVEYLLFLHWMDKQMLQVPQFTLLVISSLGITAIATPLISTLYNPTTTYKVGRRTIQHTPPNTELRILACIHGDNNVSGIINLLHLSNPTPASPFHLSALRLIELVGRASPLFIDHQNQSNSLNHTSNNPVHNALRKYTEAIGGGGVIHLQSFTSIAPLTTMYQDICRAALLHGTTLLILPYHKETLGLVRTGVNTAVMENAPCSTAVLVDKGLLQGRPWGYTSAHRVIVLFMGGCDAREALAYGDRMGESSEVVLTVVRFVCREGGEERERKLDEGMMRWFWVKNEWKKKEMVYREVAVCDGGQTMSEIQKLDGDNYDLWIVGRKEGVNSEVLEGFSEWTDSRELGCVGGFLADFGCSGSVLVVQQQVW